MRRLGGALLLAATILGCSTRAPRRPAPPGGPRPAADVDRIVRVALVVSSPRVGSEQGFTWFDADGLVSIAQSRRNDEWRLEREPRGARVRAVRADGAATGWQRSLLARSSDAGLLRVNGRRYRGELLVYPVDASLVVVNRLEVEEYLRGVVPIEIGRRPREERAAVEAQAVAARSYVYARITDNGGRRTAAPVFDVRSSTQDQAYSGADVEHDVADDAIHATRGMVLRYQGRVVSAPYFSTCGGSTAEAPEVWRGAGSAYLRRVSDRIEGTDGYYCDRAPRFRWTRTLSGAQLNAALEQYLREYTSPAPARVGSARAVTVQSRTTSGRVGVLQIETDRGRFPLRGDDIRYVLRPPGGEILSSTYFSVDSEYGRDGLVEKVTLRGRGNGHGVGMCQWGAIGRARAGQSYTTILRTYYPGTSVGPAQ